MRTALKDVVSKLCEELVLRGVPFKAHEVLDFEIMVNDRYLFTLMDNSKIIVQDTDGYTGIMQPDKVLFFGFIDDLFADEAKMEKISWKAG